VKSLRLEKRWSQEQLAQLSDLNVRTIQRVEKGKSVGAETLKSLASVFEKTLVSRTIGATKRFKCAHNSKSRKRKKRWS